MQSPKIIRVGSVFRYAYTTLFIKQHIYVRAYRGLQNSLTYQNRCFRQRVAAGGAELPGTSDPVFPIKSSRVPLARFKRLTVNMLYYSLRSVPKARGHIQGEKSFKTEVLQYLQNRMSQSGITFDHKPFIKGIRPREAPAIAR